MKEGQPLTLERERRRGGETALKVLSFGRVEDMVEDLVAASPDGNIVRLEACVKDSQGNGSGLGLRTASVLVTARRGDEVLVADLIHTYYQTLHGRPLRDGEQERATENHRVVQRVLVEQFQEKGFLIGRGAYALPDNLTIYRTTSERVIFQERKAVAKDGLTLASLPNSADSVGADHSSRREKARP